MSRARTLSSLLGNSGSLEVTPTAVSDQLNTSTGYFDVPSGTTAQRPLNPSSGMIRHNTDYGCLEQYTPVGWSTIITDLYDFSAVTFTESSNYGRTGTDQATWINRINQSWASISTNFSVTSGIIYWTVPTSGNYRITAAGAGGAPNPGASAQATSRGALMRGIISLTRGTQLQILVGKRGDPIDNGSYTSLGAGGGGTFVALASNNTPIIVAGGGGGCFNGATTLADIYYFGQTRNVPSLGFTTTPPDSLNSGYGGYGFDAGGGGGFYGDGFQSAAGGTSTTNTAGYTSPYGTQGRAFIRASDRGLGGANTTTTSYGNDGEGGFGGGGGGHTGANAAGGGGGYTGGPGGWSGWNILHGHGGGSFLHASMTNAASSDGQYNGNQVFNGYTLTNIGYNALNYAGYVTIERV